MSGGATMKRFASVLSGVLLIVGVFAVVVRADGDKVIGVCKKGRSMTCANMTDGRGGAGALLTGTTFEAAP